MSEKDINTSTVKDGDLDAVNGGVTLKPDNGFFTGVYNCPCGNTDFKVVGFYDNGDSLIVQCKKCGQQHYGVKN